VVIIDEAAFHDDLEGLLKAAFALLMWGGKVIVISTHEGTESPFNEWIGLTKAGRRDDAIVRITFDQALRDGLYMRICQVKREEWTPEAEARYRAKIYRTYGPGADEELRAIPTPGGGRYFTRAMVEACTDKDLPVYRFTPPEGFLTWTEDQRRAECADWIAEHLAPALARLHPALRCALANDFALTGDLSIFAPIQICANLSRRIPFLVEMRAVPYEQQKQIFDALAKGLPRLGRIHLDARGNGQILAAYATLTYGNLVEQVFLRAAYYAERFPRLKARFEDQTIIIPADAETVDDLLMVKVIEGVPRIPAIRTTGKTGKRHGDAAVAILLAEASADDMRTISEAHGLGDMGVAGDLDAFVGG
jgi:phage FluMu gp28-like protein